MFFNPHSIEEIAGVVKTLTLDKNLRDEYQKRGFRRLQDFSLEQMAKSYLAVYRKSAGRDVSGENDD